jgi:hypothetical protein
MRRVLIFIFCLLSFVFNFKQIHALEINPINESLQSIAQGLNDSLVGEKIERFESNITVLPDGSIDVRESITYFFDTDRHGIYTDIYPSLFTTTTRDLTWNLYLVM